MRYLSQFLDYIWLENRIKQCPTMRFVAREYQSEVLLASSYPLEQSKEAVIIEIPSSSFYLCGLDKMVEQGKITSTGVELLGALFQSRDYDISLRAKQSYWQDYILNNCQYFCHQNVALIGEAGTSAHYSLGIGLDTAFTTALQLHKALLCGKEIQQSLQNYSSSIEGWLKKIYDLSVRQLLWIHNVKHTYHKLTARQFIQAFNTVA